MTTRRTTLQCLLIGSTVPVLCVRQVWAQGGGLASAEKALSPGGPVEAAIDELAADGRFSGAVHVNLAGRPLIDRAWGLADRERGIGNDPETRFNIASAGKMFTAVAIGQLLENGRVGLGDRLDRHLPDFPPAIASRITIGQLLAHSSGLGSYFSHPGWAEKRAAIRRLADFVELVEGESPQGEPGAGYRYSNSGYVLLGALIERLSGHDYYEAMRRLIFEPAGMRKTGYPIAGEAADDLAIGYHNGCFARPPASCTPSGWSDARALWGGRGSPAGGGVSTVRDLQAFVDALRGGRLLRPETFAMMKAEHGRIERPGGPIDAYGLGFGRLRIHGRPSWGHSGGTPGAQAQVDVFEDAPLSFIVLGNQDGGQRLVSTALRRTLAPIA